MSGAGFLLGGLGQCVGPDVGSGMRSGCLDQHNEGTPLDGGNAGVTCEDYALCAWRTRQAAGGGRSSVVVCVSGAERGGWDAGDEQRCEPGGERDRADEADAADQGREDGLGDVLGVECVAESDPGGVGDQEQW